MKQFCLDIYIFEDSSDLENLPLLNTELTLILQFCFQDDLLKCYLRWKTILKMCHLSHKYHFFYFIEKIFSVFKTFRFLHF